jgi:hypothetical protein
MNRAILQPTIFASGITLFLYAHNQNLSLGSYLAPIPFWILVGRPLGLLWNQKFLKEINRDIFPAEMKNYRELYLVSRRAMVYDIIFNHSIYNPMLSLIIIGYTHCARKLEEKVRGEEITSHSLGQILKETGIGLLQMRGMVSLTSIIS